jgi:5-methylcytosine-specific restriction endonuclease McrA
MTAKPILAPVRFCKKCQTDTERKADGHCKVCANAYSAAWYAENRERHNASTAARVKEHPEKKKALGVAYRKAHLEKIKVWLYENQDKVKAYRAEWEKNNPDKRKTYRAKWQSENPEARRLNDQNRRARVASSGGVLSKGLETKLFKLQKGKCACCGEPLGENYHLDHIMPIALGGSNTDDNIQLLRQRCNNQKRALHPVDFMQSRGFLL